MPVNTKRRRRTPRTRNNNDVYTIVSLTLVCIWSRFQHSHVLSLSQQRTNTKLHPTTCHRRSRMILNSSNNEGGADTKQFPRKQQSEPSGEDEMGRKSFGTYSARYLEDNGLELTTDEDGRVTARPPEREQSMTQEKETKRKNFPTLIRPTVKEQPPKIVPSTGFNVVLTHCTADFDSLASAVGLAKLWSSQVIDGDDKSEFDSSSEYPTFVVLPRGAHPSVQRFLSLHKYLFPIRSLKSLPPDLSGLDRLGLVDAQRRERIGPAEHLLKHANRVTIVDHHLDTDSDIPEATDYILDKVGSVSTLIAERLKEADLVEGLTEAEATLLALGIHADTGSLCYDSTTPRDASALAWVMEQGASQAAIAEHAKSSLSLEQQGVLTQALINTNSTIVHGVTISTVLLTADGFINGLAAVTQDALELSSSDIYLMGVVYEAKSGGQGKRSSKKNSGAELLKSQLLQRGSENKAQVQQQQQQRRSLTEEQGMYGTEEDDRLLRERLKFEFDRQDVDGSGYLDKVEIRAALMTSRTIATDDDVDKLMEAIDTNGDGKIDFEEFVQFAKEFGKLNETKRARRSKTLIIIGRVKAGVGMKGVKLGKLLEKFGGGGHAKAASATVRLRDESEAQEILSGLVEELSETCLEEQPTVGDFMTTPCLSVKSDMTERQVEDLFTRYDVRALPVVDDNNDVIGLVTYKEVAAAKQRLWNKEQKRLRQLEMDRPESKSEDIQQSKVVNGEAKTKEQQLKEERRKQGSTVKVRGKRKRYTVEWKSCLKIVELNFPQISLLLSMKAWMKQHVRTVEASQTMFEVEAILLDNDVGCIPVVADGSKQLVGMVTRTDLLRQHRYYPSLRYKGLSDSIEERKPIIELRQRS